MRCLLSLLVLVAAAVGCQSVGVATDDLQTITLLSRSAYHDYEACTFSFEYGVRDDKDRKITRNDWDLQFGNGGDLFHVDMVTDDRSMIWDLGPVGWEEVDLSALPFEESYPDNKVKVPAIEGNLYLVHTRDSNTDLRSLFRVDYLEPGDHVDITWKKIDA